MTDYTTQIQKAYIAYYGRPADPSGLDYWNSRLNETKGDLSAIINDFGTSDEARALWQSDTTVESLTKIYLRLFNRDIDSEGLNYWTGKIDSGEVSLVEASMSIFYGAKNQDSVALENKLTFSKNFTESLRENQDLANAYQGEKAATVLRDLVNDIVYDSEPLYNLELVNQVFNTITQHGVTFSSTVIQGDPHIDQANSFTYSWGKPNALTYADFDKDGDTDVMFFPSNFTQATSIPIAVFLNDGTGKYSYSYNFIQNETSVQFVRDVVEGDFDKDGDIDYVLLDQGWELNNRDPNYFYGATVKYLKQTDNGLVMRDLGTSTKSFNHTGDAGDINRDGNLDFITANFGKNNMEFGIYLGDGRGNFTLNQSAATGVFEYNSGATFVNIGGVTKVAVGSYRGWQQFPNTLDHDVEIFGWQNGKLVFEQTLPRPFDSTYGRNYGTSNMFNQDINGDGREDLVVAWETEADRAGSNVSGFQDGITAIPNPDNPNGPMLRYGEIGLENQLWAVYTQTSNGKFKLTDTMNGTGVGSAVEMRFVDIDGDGDIDMYNNNFGSHPNNWNENWFMNDGKGNFAHPEEFDVSAIQGITSWQNDLTEFFDANGDGIVDAVALDTIFPSDITPGAGHDKNIGAALDVYLADSFSPVYDPLQDVTLVGFLA